MYRGAESLEPPNTSVNDGTNKASWCGWLARFWEQKFKSRSQV